MLWPSWLRAYIRPRAIAKSPPRRLRRGFRPGTEPTITDTREATALEAVSGGWNAGRTGDDRAGSPHRRRSIQIRFCHRYRIRQGSQGTVGGHGSLYFGQKGRAGVDAELAARRLPALADHARADLGAGEVQPDRLPGHLLLLGTEEEDRAEVARRDRPRNP